MRRAWSAGSLADARGLREGGSVGNNCGGCNSGEEDSGITVAANVEADERRSEGEALIAGTTAGQRSELTAVRFRIRFMVAGGRLEIASES